MTTTEARDVHLAPESGPLGALRDHRLGFAVVRPSRGADDDLDVLVEPTDLPRALALLRSAGFVEEPAFGRGTHRFLVRLEGRCFVRLDLVTSLDFGPLMVWRSEMAHACLRRSGGGTETALLDPRDEFWVTLLHLVADDGAEPRGSHRLDRLRALAEAEERDASEDWRTVVTAVLPKSMTTERLVALCVGRDTKELGEALSTLRRSVRRRCLRVALDPREVARVASTAMLRATEPVRQWPGRRGLLVTILGPDGAGKSTLAETLGGAWLWPHQRVYFGLWPDSNDSTLMGKALWPLRRPFRAVARYGRGSMGAAAGRLVLFDRYVYDAAAPPHGRLQGLKRLYFAVLLRCVPAPDLAVLLEAPGDVLHARKGEMTPRLLDENREAIFRYVREVQRRTGRPRVVTVDATRPASAVADEVMAAVWRTASERLQRATREEQA